MTSMKDKFEELLRARSELAELERDVARARQAELMILHEKLGFASRRDLIAALLELGGHSFDFPVQSLPAACAEHARVATRPGREGNGPRARLSAELKREIIEAIEAGERGVDVARRFGISIPTLHNLKKAAGLIRFPRHSVAKHELRRLRPHRESEH